MSSCNAMSGHSVSAWVDIYSMYNAMSCHSLSSQVDTYSDFYLQQYQNDVEVFPLHPPSSVSIPFHPPQRYLSISLSARPVTGVTWITGVIIALHLHFCSSSLHVSQAPACESSPWVRVKPLGASQAPACESSPCM